jgi:Zn-dependent protease
MVTTTLNRAWLTGGTKKIARNRPMNTRPPTFVACCWTRAAAFLAFLQAFALVLNLLPLPGLDGFGVIRPYLPPAIQQQAAKFGSLVFIGLFLAIFFVPPINHALFSVVVTISDLFGVSRPDIGAGYRAFRFWETLGA